MQTSCANAHTHSGRRKLKRHQASQVYAANKILAISFCGFPPFFPKRALLLLHCVLLGQREDISGIAKILRMLLRATEEENNNGRRWRRETLLEPNANTRYFGSAQCRGKHVISHKTFASISESRSSTVEPLFCSYFYQSKNGNGKYSAHMIRGVKNQA